jgi:hypothetical protein
LAYQDADNFEALKENQSLSGIMDYYGQLHRRVLSEFAGIKESELDAPAVFWESEPMLVEFRLHRFDSHLRQHTIQVEKTLGLLGLYSNEAKRLLRLIYNALADVEGAVVGAPEYGLEPRAALAEKITFRAGEIEALFKV